MLFFEMHCSAGTVHHNPLSASEEIFTPLKVSMAPYHIPMRASEQSSGRGSSVVRTVMGDVVQAEGYKRPIFRLGEASQNKQRMQRIEPRMDN